MKKKFTFFLLLLTTTLSLTACGSFKCDLCRQEKSGKSYTAEIIGKKITICKDCKAKIDKGIDGIESGLEFGLNELEHGLDELGDLFK